MPDVPSRVVELVETFDRNVQAYRSQQYKEAQLCREFIDPFFHALGWDVANEKGYAQAYKEVIHEDAIKIGGYTKAPDYCFRIGGTRKFFLEAKKPSIDIKGDPHPAYQLRRYAWSAKLPLSILTDFEEFAVYDCQTRPKHTDKADTARIMYITYKHYSENWAKIADVFGREAILKGSFDKFAASTRRKRGTTTVDTEFLAELEKWRSELARIIALRNTTLSTHEINFSVQRTIDRIIFLRMAEDRGIEPYGQLQTISSGDRTYPRLCELFEKADHKYNSGLFYFQKEPGRPEGPDELTLNLVIDDNPLKYMLHSLYYPQCPYEFSVLPAEILGNVYEQFLGSVITISGAHRAKVQPKPEVKKAGGVYYTPSYIVDYIVKNTVGKLVEGKTPKQIENMKILDPACGSGSFLLGAYTYLLNYHRDWYVENDPQKHTKQIYQGKGGQWFLTITGKKRILLNNIFGVDIDSQAVEVTKLSLLLKVLEGETSETVGQTYRIFHERALPDLGNNIKCGNSLIGPDFFDSLAPTPAVGAISNELRDRINPFDWHAEFPEIFKGKNPGFDVVIGNPPYVRQEILGQQAKDYFSNRYVAFTPTADLYVYFVERSIKLLNSQGVYSMIISNKWMKTTYGKSLRKFITKEAKIEEILDFGELPVFQGVGTFPSIICARPDSRGTKNFRYAPMKKLVPTMLSEMVQEIAFHVSLIDADVSSRLPLVSCKERKILEKIKTKSVSLANYCGDIVNRGIVTGFNKAFVIDEHTRHKLIDEDQRSEQIIKPFAVGDNVRKYHINFENQYIIFARRGINIKAYPAIEKYLKQFKHQLTPKPTGWKGQAWKGRKPGKYQWYEIQDSTEYYKDFEKPKIVYPEIAKESRFAFDENNLFLNKTCFLIPKKDFYLLGLLNSSLAWLFLRRTCSVLGDPDKGGRLMIQWVYISQLPIRTIDFDNPDDKSKHQKMVKLVERMLDLHKKLNVAKVPAEKTCIRREIDTTDKQIDKLVYDLYGLTEEEIKIVENSN